jgi:hypothetical protein
MDSTAAMDLARVDTEESKEKLVLSAVLCAIRGYEKHRDHERVLQEVEKALHSEFLHGGINISASILESPMESMPMPTRRCVLESMLMHCPSFVQMIRYANLLDLQQGSLYTLFLRKNHKDMCGYGDRFGIGPADLELILDKTIPERQYEDFVYWLDFVDESLFSKNVADRIRFKDKDQENHVYLLILEHNHRNATRPISASMPVSMESLYPAPIPIPNPSASTSSSDGEAYGCVCGDMVDQCAQKSEEEIRLTLRTILARIHQMQTDNMAELEESLENLKKSMDPRHEYSIPLSPLLLDCPLRGIVLPRARQKILSALIPYFADYTMAIHCVKELKSDSWPISVYLKDLREHPQTIKMPELIAILECVSADKRYEEFMSWHEWVDEQIETTPKVIQNLLVEWHPAMRRDRVGYAIEKHNRKYSMDSASASTTPNPSAPEIGIKLEECYIPDKYGKCTNCDKIPENGRCGCTNSSFPGSSLGDYSTFPCPVDPRHRHSRGENANMQIMHEILGRKQDIADIIQELVRFFRNTTPFFSMPISDSFLGCPLGFKMDDEKIPLMKILLPYCSHFHLAVDWLDLLRKDTSQARDFVCFLTRHHRILYAAGREIRIGGKSFLKLLKFTRGQATRFELLRYWMRFVVGYVSAPAIESLIILNDPSVRETVTKIVGKHNRACLDFGSGHLPTPDGAIRQMVGGVPRELKVGQCVSCHWLVENDQCGCTERVVSATTSTSASRFEPKFEKPFLKTLAGIIQQKDKNRGFILNELKSELGKYGSISGPISCEWLRDVLRDHKDWSGFQYSIMKILIPHSDDIYETIRWTGLLDSGFKHTFLNFVAEYVSKHKHNLIEATDLVNILGYNCPINRLNTLEKWIPLVPVQIPENVIREAFKGTSANDYEQAMRLCRTHNARLSCLSSAPSRISASASTIGTRESRIHQAMTASGSGDVSRAVQYAVNRAVGEQIRDTKSQPALFVDTGGVEIGTYGGLDVNIKNCFSDYEIPKHMTRVAAEAVMAAVAAEFLRRATFPAHMDEEMKEAAVAAAAAEAMEEIEIEIQEEDTVVEAKPQTSSESESESKRRKREVVDLDKEEDDDDDECKICMEESRTHVLNPCGHWCLCGECSAKVEKCPICRVKIVSCIRVFKS